MIIITKIAFLFKILKKFKNILLVMTSFKIIFDAQMIYSQ